MNQSIPVARTRRTNLQKWLATFATDVAAAAVLDMSPSQLAQIAGPNPSRNIGTKIARRLEKQLGKPEGWLDTQHEPAARDPDFDRLLTQTRQLANEGRLSDQQIATVRSMLALVTETTPAAYNVGPAITPEQTHAPPPRSRKRQAST